jgi:hypothetical protein
MQQSRRILLMILCFSQGRISIKRDSLCQIVKDIILFCGKRSLASSAISPPKMIGNTFYLKVFSLTDLLPKNNGKPALI